MRGAGAENAQAIAMLADATEEMLEEELIEVHADRSSLSDAEAAN